MRHINALKIPSKVQAQLMPSWEYMGFAANGRITPNVLRVAEVAPMAEAANTSVASTT